MTASGDLLIDAFGRIREAVHEAVDGLSPMSWPYGWTTGRIRSPG